MILNRVGLTEKVVPKKLNGNKEVSHVTMWRISRGNSQRKGPNAGVYLEGFKELQGRQCRLERMRRKKDYKLDYNVCMLNI